MGKSKKQTINNGDIPSSVIPFQIEVKPGGRPTALTPTTLLLLREAFLLGCDDDEACNYAGIARATLYNHQKGNQAFLDWKETLKRTPFLKARKTIVNHLENDPEFALRYMERKKKAEFAPQAKLTIDDQRDVLDDDTKAQISQTLNQHFAKLKAKNDADGDVTRSIPNPDR